MRGGSWVTVNLSKTSFFTTPWGLRTETEVVTCQAGPAVKNGLMLIRSLRFICLWRMLNLQTPQSTTQSCPAATGAVAWQQSLSQSKHRHKWGESKLCRLIKAPLKQPHELSVNSRQQSPHSHFLYVASSFEIPKRVHDFISFHWKHFLLFYSFYAARNISEHSNCPESSSSTGQTFVTF